MVSETYAPGRQDETRAGGVLIALISVLAGALVLAGLVYAAGTGQRHKAALAASGCEPNLSPSGLHCTTFQMLERQYLAFEAPDMQQLSTDTSAYVANERSNLPAAEDALKAEVSLESAFGRSLSKFPFPPAVAPAAGALIKANQVRAELTAEQARSSSLVQMRSLDGKVSAACVTVDADLNSTFKALQVRPTANQEP